MNEEHNILFQSINNQFLLAEGQKRLPVWLVAKSARMTEVEGGNSYLGTALIDGTTF